MEDKEMVDDGDRYEVFRKKLLAASCPVRLHNETIKKANEAWAQNKGSFSKVSLRHPWKVSQEMLYKKGMKKLWQHQ